MSDTLIKVDNVSKKFCRDLKRSLFFGAVDLGYELLGSKNDFKKDLRAKEFWAVNDVSFHVKRGECIGLIGPNGSGKSTILKMLNGLIKPDTGRIEMYGRVGALIELGAGFNPILTGRENIYVNASVLGFKKREIDKLFDKIVDFSELEDFIDTPVQYYSSGMKVRLGFSVASQLRPDILLIDEVLAVGDAGFKIKCINEIYEMMKNASIIFVSHSMSQVGKICTSGLVMANGKSFFKTDNIAELILNYYELFKDSNFSYEGKKAAEIINFKFGNIGNEVTYIESCVIKRNEVQLFKTLEKTKILIEIGFPVIIDEFSIYLSFLDYSNNVVLQISPMSIKNSSHSITVQAHLDNLPLNTGIYTVTVQILNKNKSDWGDVLIGYRDLFTFKVKKEKYEGIAPVMMDAKWLIG